MIDLPATFGVVPSGKNTADHVPDGNAVVLNYRLQRRLRRGLEQHGAEQQDGNHRCTLSDETAPIPPEKETA